jgi:hypothetical protein
LQSFAVVVWRSNKRFESPNPLNDVDGDDDDDDDDVQQNASNGQELKSNVEIAFNTFNKHRITSLRGRE